MLLAGGASRRLGGISKGLETIGNKRVVDRVVAALRPIAPDLRLVANDPDAVHWLPGVAVLADIHVGGGGLAGVEAALDGGRDALVVAWDMPFVTTPLLALLLDAARRHDADVALPESDSPYGVEPFCAFYSWRARAPLARFFAEGGGAARNFLGRLPGVHRVPISEVARVGDPRRLFFSINTPDDLQRARAMMASAE